MIKELGKLFMLWLLIFTAICIVIKYAYIMTPMDNSDKSRFKRSGLSVYTDYKTGLQYIGVGYFGSIIPRLDENGKHMRASNEDIQD